MATAEVWVAAALSRDKDLMSVFQEITSAHNAKAADLHSTIAHMVFNLPCAANEVKKLYPAMRQAAKAITSKRASLHGDVY